MNNRYDGTNGNGYQPLPLHGDDNPKAPPRCAKPEEAEGVERQRMIESMCLTWRHDFGLDAPAPGSLASGMTESGRQHLRGEMGKLFDHHFAPALSAVTAERDRLESMLIRTATRHFAQQWKDRADDKKLDECLSEGIAMLEAERDQLRAEVEALRKDAVRWRYVRLQGDDTHWLNLLRVDLEDFGGNINAAVDALIDGDTPATAAKEA